MHGRLIIAVSVVTGMGMAALPQQKPSTPKELASVVRITQLGFQPLHADNKVLVIDVRGREAFEEGRIPGAVNVPLADMDKRIGEIAAKASGRPIVAYCACPMEHTAAEAGLILQKHGLEDVRVLVGGYPDWVRSGGKIEK